MNKSNKTKGAKHLAKASTLESLKEEFKGIGSATANQMRQETKEVSRNFMDQLFGSRAPKNFSGEIVPGEALEFKEVLSGRREDTEKVRKQMVLERRLLEEERVRVEKRGNELKIQLQVIREEILVLAEKTENLAEDTQIAAMQAPIEPGLYHLIFFEKLLEFIKSFSKKIEQAHIWLNSLNKRAQKKNVWGARYKKGGAKYLLSSEHYLSRSAG